MKSPAAERPRVLSVRFGFNPNSSSLGIDISFLLVGLGGVSVITAALSAWLSAAPPPPPSPGGGAAS